jgi:hypothetical protein
VVVEVNLSGFSTYLDGHILDYVFGNTAFSPAGPLYVGLSSTNIADDGSGITEPSGGGYARVGVANNTNAWANTVAGVKTNGTAIGFPVSTAPWGGVSYFFISDAGSGGNVYAKGSVTPAQTISTSQRLTFAVGDMSLSLT